MVVVESRLGRVKLHDVAAAAGLSQTQVSRALAGYADVAEGTRERVKTLARKLGYHPSSRGRLLRGGGPPRCAVVSLGVTLDEIGRSQFLGSILTGIMARAAVEGMDVHLAPVPVAEREEKPAALTRLIAADRGDGLILITLLPLSVEDVAPLEEAGIPYVLANRHFGTYPVNAVTVDYTTATKDAVVRLHALGHRRMALILQQRDSSTVRDHEAGWLEGLSACGVDERCAPILSYSEGTGVARRLIRRVVREGLPASGARPTAVVCITDTLGHRTLQEAAAAGLRVPEDLSVVVFGDIVAPYTSPPLCGYSFRQYDVGMESACLLASLLRGARQDPTHIRLVAPFTNRGSSGPVPA